MQIQKFKREAWKIIKTAKNTFCWKERVENEMALKRHGWHANTVFGKQNWTMDPERASKLDTELPSW